MITSKDIKKLSSFFATKDDLKAMENRIISRFNYVVDYFDDKIINHEKRITSLEGQRSSFR